MPTNKLSGNLLGVEINGKFVTCETSCEFNFDADMMAASATQSGGWKEVIQGLKSWSVSVNAAMLVQSAETDLTTIINAFASGERMRIRIKTKVAMVGSILITGYVVVQNGGLSAAVNSTAGWNTVLQGDGPFQLGDTENYQMFYGYRLQDPYDDELTLQPQFSKEFEFGVPSISLDFTPQSAGNYLFALVPHGQPIFNIWENNQFNFGNIPDFAWREVRTIGGFDYYISRSILYITSAVPVITFRYKNLIPDQFYFNDIIDALLSTVYESNTIIASGITEPVLASVSGGEISINNQAYTTVSAYVSAGDSVKVRVTSSASYTTAVGATLTINGISDTFDVTTAENTTLYYAYNSDLFYKTCSPGSTGTAVSYSKQYTSAISQDDADDIAAADISNFNSEGQSNADLNGTCVPDTVYIWGKIFESNSETISGITYVDVFLQTYGGGTATAPPPDLSQPLNCTNTSIAVTYVDGGGNHRNFTVSMTNQQNVRVVAPDTSNGNPVYPKQATRFQNIFVTRELWFQFTGKNEGDWNLLQTIF